MISSSNDTERSVLYNLYLVYTPLQLFSILNIINSSFKGSNNEIAIFHQNMTSYSKLINGFNPKIKILSYKFAFEKTYRGNKISIYFKLLAEMLSIKNQIKFFNNHRLKYDNIFVPSKAIGCNVAYAHFIKNNPNLVLNVYDDGVGTYDTKYFEFKKYNLYRIASNILLKSFIWDNIANLYCFSPEILDKNNKNDIVIKKIVTSEKVKLLFSCDASNIYNKYLQKKVVFFEQGSRHADKNDIFEFFNIYNKYFNMSEIIVKKHPRLDLALGNLDVSIDDSGKMFESILFNIDCKDSLLVSVTSTACITPYMMLGEMPYVIFLGNIGTKRNSNVLEAKYMKNIVNTYKSDRIFMPKTLMELDRILNFLEKKLDPIVEKNIDYVASE